MTLLLNPSHHPSSTPSSSLTTVSTNIILKLINLRSIKLWWVSHTSISTIPIWLCIASHAPATQAEVFSTAWLEERMDFDCWDTSERGVCKVPWFAGAYCNCCVHCLVSHQLMLISWLAKTFRQHQQCNWFLRHPNGWLGRAEWAWQISWATHWESSWPHHLVVGPPGCIPPTFWQWH